MYFSSLWQKNMTQGCAQDNIDKPLGWKLRGRLFWAAVPLTSLVNSCRHPGFCISFGCIHVAGAVNRVGKLRL